MTTSLFVSLVVLLALVAANLPFFTNRFLLAFVLSKPKALHIRLLELVIFYFLAGGFGRLLERRVGQIAPQTWEFYAITGTLFLTFAFPGFVYRYLLKRGT
ncbi:DUF2818 family protein [Rhodoferax aquaticus]|uniref:DUF2818 family protein n=1 Tax=Rhodoferax aquaticus TaxID=2527691 RepID=A0A515EQH5_9BURK|nr:DUF2818 family protein [Rhodoferax aquaticus]QDL54921.1 DUF2818 family protein [Rhodoferax aquaticus]